MKWIEGWEGEEVERRELQNVGQRSSEGGGAETTTECGSA